ncbi:CPBP family intramembrane metalloprotease [bacterium]|nr:CPBP family intramembrane metalloprotease [bacterium]
MAGRLAARARRRLYCAMLQADRLVARLGPWFLLAVTGLCFLLYQVIQWPFYARGPWWIGVGTSLAAGVGVVLPLFTLTRRLGIPFRAQFQIERPALVPSLAVAAATLSLVPPLGILTAAMARYVPPEAAYLRWVATLRPESPLGWLAVVFALVLAGPLAEELIFRGLLQRLLQRLLARPVWLARLGFSRGGLAVLIGALLFGAVHPPHSIPGAALLGLFFGALLLLLGNLSYPLIAHAIWNLANLVMLQQSGGDLERLIQTPFAESSALWLLVSLFLFVFFSRLWLQARV